MNYRKHLENFGFIVKQKFVLVNSKKTNISYLISKNNSSAHFKNLKQAYELIIKKA
jgi:hypothetical protein